MGELVRKQCFDRALLLARRLSAALFLVLCFLLLAFCSPAQAQPAKIPRIAFLVGTSLSAASDRIEAFRQGLRELGYVEGRNIIIEWRSADGKNDRLPALAAELVGLKVDVIVSSGPITTRSTREATLRFPLLWGLIMILLARGSSPALRSRAGILLDYRTSARS